MEKPPNSSWVVDENQVNEFLIKVKSSGNFGATQSYKQLA
jgi:hypothetical protein